MKIGNDWDTILKDVFESQSFRELIMKVNEEYKKDICYPIKQEVFNAIKLTPYKDVKVVIVGSSDRLREGCARTGDRFDRLDTVGDYEADRVLHRHLVAALRTGAVRQVAVLFE